MLYVVNAARYHRRGFDCLPLLRPMCRRLVRKHRDKIKRVAKALLERRTLTADKVDELITQ
jgi:ATP-dependent Zn protease